jgi:hypothetical protein
MKLFKNKECWEAFCKPINVVFDIFTGVPMRLLMYFAIVLCLLAFTAENIMTHYYNKEKELLKYQSDIKLLQMEAELKYSEKAWEREQTERRNEAINERIINGTEDITNLI